MEGEIEKVEAIGEINEFGRVVHSATIGKLALALAKAQGQIKGAVKDSSNPFFKSKYADLQSVWEACREPLSKNGLSVVQLPASGTETVTVVTYLLHESGEYIGAELVMTPVKTDPQGVGSCISYARRYALASVVGIYQADDDANAATGKEKEKPHAAQEPPSESEPSSGRIAGVIEKVQSKQTQGGKPYGFVYLKGQSEPLSTFDTAIIPILTAAAGSTLMFEYKETGKGERRFKNITDYYDPPPEYNGETTKGTDDDVPF